MEIIWVEIGTFSADFEAVFVAWVADEVHGDMLDHGHILRT